MSTLAQGTYRAPAEDIKAAQKKGRIRDRTLSQMIAEFVKVVAKAKTDSKIQILVTNKKPRK